MIFIENLAIGFVFGLITFINLNRKPTLFTLLQFFYKSVVIVSACLLAALYFKLGQYIGLVALIVSFFSGAIASKKFTNSIANLKIGSSR